MRRVTLAVWLLLSGCTGTLDGEERDGALPASDADVPARDAGPAPRDAAPPRDAGPGCTPTTCEAVGAQCGSVGDGCGGSLACGDCTGEEVCGGGGVANVCAVPPACPPAPAGATDAQRQAFERVNEVREQVGAPCAAMIAEINQAAQSHADYGAMNAGDPSCRSSGHDQTEGCPGFTGASFGARLGAAGYSGGSFEIVHFLGNPRGAVDGWLGTLWHRIPLVLPQTDHYGAGFASRFDVMDFGRRQGVDPDGVWFYPAEGMTVSGRGGDEVPSPPDAPASCGATSWGTFITIMFGEGGATVDSHTLTGPSGEEEHTWVTPSDSSFLAGTVFAMVPCPLSSGSYTVVVRGTHRSGAPFDRSVTFQVR